jgi:hypothetical protein
VTPKEISKFGSTPVSTLSGKASISFRAEGLT